MVVIDIFAADEMLPLAFCHVIMGAGRPLNAQWMLTYEPTDVSIEAGDCDWSLGETKIDVLVDKI